MTVVTIDTEDPIAIAAVGAIHHGDLVGLQRLLADFPELATARLGDDDHDGMSRTLLHVVSDWPGHFPGGAATVHALVAAGADVNARFHGSHNETPLHWAASSDDLEVLDALIDCGANIEAPGAVIGGGPPLADARAFNNSRAAHRLVAHGATTTLTDAAALGLLDRVEQFFASPTAPPLPEINGAFWAACSGGQQPAAQYLLNRGADINWIPEWEHVTPLDAAARSRNPALVRWLHTLGAATASWLRAD